MAARLGAGAAPLLHARRRRGGELDDEPGPRADDRRQPRLSAAGGGARRRTNTRPAWRPLRPLVFLGFSQGVAMAFRGAADEAPRCAGIIALGGDVPPDVRARETSLPPVLLGRGQQRRVVFDGADGCRRGVAARRRHRSHALRVRRRPRVDGRLPRSCRGVSQPSCRQMSRPVTRYPLSVIRHSAFIRHPTSAIRHATSAILHPASAIRLGCDLYARGSPIDQRGASCHTRRRERS